MYAWKAQIFLFQRVFGSLPERKVGVGWGLFFRSALFGEFFEEFGPFLSLKVRFFIVFAEYTVEVFLDLVLLRFSDFNRTTLPWWDHTLANNNGVWLRLAEVMRRIRGRAAIIRGSAGTVVPALPTENLKRCFRRVWKQTDFSRWG